MINGQSPRPYCTPELQLGQRWHARLLDRERRGRDWYWNQHQIVGQRDLSRRRQQWLDAAAALEHRFDGTMFSLFGSASWFTFNTTARTIAGSPRGARIFFDNPGGTLQQYDWSTPFPAARAVSF